MEKNDNLIPAAMHSLRTPVNSIVGLTVLARRSDNLETIKKYLGRIEEASYQLINTVNNLSDIYQMDGEQLYLESNDFDLEDLIDSVLDIVYVKADERDISIFLDLRDVYRVRVTTDRYKLAKAMYNILSNAIDFCDRGGKVMLRTHMLNERELYIEIGNNGIGLAPEKIEAMFGITTGSEITALPICRKIISLMGGELVIESDIELGTRFFFTVKLHSVKLSRGEPARSLRIMHPRMLIVDKNFETAAYFDGIAKEIGAKITAADTLAAAARFFTHGSSTNSVNTASGINAENSVFDMIFLSFEMAAQNFDAIIASFLRHISYKRIILMVKNSRRAALQRMCDNAGYPDMRIITMPILPAALFELTAAEFGIKNDHSVRRQNAPDFTGRHILIVDDHDITREITAGILEPTRAGIDFAENGKAAVEMYSSSPEKYDAILMDVQMPVMDGLTATRSIRAGEHKNARTIPVIAMTANIFDLDKKSCYDAGMSSYISKPISVRELYRILADVITEARGERTEDFL
jgi:CheY-like chemotaxis protein